MNQLIKEPTLQKNMELNSFSLNDIFSQADVPTKEENEKLVLAAQKGDKNALDELIRRNGRLILKLVGHYCHEPSKKDDYIQEGVLGLMRAVEKFDPEKDASFSTYAVAWINQKITRYFADHDKVIRRPAHIVGYINKYNHLIEQYSAKGKELTDEIIMKELDISLDKCQRIKKAATPECSLNNLVGEDSKMTLVDTVADTSVDIEKKVISDSISVQIKEILKKNLSPKEYDILARRFGMDGYTAQTLEQVAHVYNVTRERIRQIQSRAMRRCGRRELSAFM